MLNCYLPLGIEAYVFTCTNNDTNAEYKRIQQIRKPFFLRPATWVHPSRNLDSATPSPPLPYSSAGGRAPVPENRFSGHMCTIVYGGGRVCIVLDGDDGTVRAESVLVGEKMVMFRMIWRNAFKRELTAISFTKYFLNLIFQIYRMNQYFYVNTLQSWGRVH